MINVDSDIKNADWPKRTDDWPKGDGVRKHSHVLVPVQVIIKGKHYAVDTCWCGYVDEDTWREGRR